MQRANKQKGITEVYFLSAQNLKTLLPLFVEFMFFLNEEQKSYHSEQTSFKNFLQMSDQNSGGSNCPRELQNFSSPSQCTRVTICFQLIKHKKLFIFFLLRCCNTLVLNYQFCEQRRNKCYLPENSLFDLRTALSTRFLCLSGKKKKKTVEKVDFYSKGRCLQAQNKQ